MSVDDPIQGSTPALRHPWLAHHTYPEALINLVHCLHVRSFKHEAFKHSILAADYSTQTIRATDLPTIHMVKTHLAGAAASVARDGEAPESGQDDPLREKQHLRGTSGTRFD